MERLGQDCQIYQTNCKYMISDNRHTIDSGEIFSIKPNTPAKPKEVSVRQQGQKGCKNCNCIVEVSDLNFGTAVSWGNGFLSYATPVASTHLDREVSSFDCSGYSHEPSSTVESKCSASDHGDESFGSKLHVQDASQDGAKVEVLIEGATGTSDISGAEDPNLDTPVAVPEQKTIEWNVNGACNEKEKHCREDLQDNVVDQNSPEASTQAGRSAQFAPSTPLKGQKNVYRRPKVGIDLNKKPRQKVKKKKHTPKVISEGKASRAPKCGTTTPSSSSISPSPRSKGTRKKISSEADTLARQVDEPNNNKTSKRKRKNTGKQSIEGSHTPPEDANVDKSFERWSRCLEDVHNQGLQDSEVQLNSNIEKSHRTSRRSCRRRLDVSANDMEDEDVIPLNEHCNGHLSRESDGIISQGLHQAKQGQKVVVNHRDADQTGCQVVPSSRSNHNRRSVRLFSNRKGGTNFPPKFKKKRTDKKSVCLVESRKVGPNFPRKFKKKRIERKRAFRMLYFPRRLKKKRTGRKRVTSYSEFWPCILRSKSEFQRQCQAHLTTTVSKQASALPPASGCAINFDEEAQEFTAISQWKLMKSLFMSESSLNKLKPPLRARSLEGNMYQSQDAETTGEEIILQHEELEPLIQNMICLSISGGATAIPQSIQGKDACFPVGDHDAAVMPDEITKKKKKKKKPPKVHLDDESKQMWKQLMLLDNGDERSDTNEDSDKKWEREREVFRGRVDSFIVRMHQILGDRRFTPWKGSVVDSVVGVFLTQNVADYLSSSAFLALAAKFPLQSKSASEEDKESVEIPEIIRSQDEPIGPGCTSTKFMLSQAETGAGEEVEKTGGASPVAEGLVAEEESQNISSFENSQVSHSEKQESNPNSLSNECSVQECDAKTEIRDTENCRNIQVDEILESGDISSQKQESKNKAMPAINVEHNGRQQRRSTATSNKKKNKATQKERKAKAEKISPLEWEKLRKAYPCAGPRRTDHLDSVDWEAVRCAELSEVAEAIKERGQHYQIAARIQEFLNRLITLHNCIDLEWLRHCPPDKAKAYLLDVYGLGLKSVECVRLLSLQNVAFPVDTNVGRIAVRLGWVPLQPLPENLQIHLLEKYPIMDDIQKYLWPRLCTLDQRVLYELHYQLITFGKVFCTKTNPNCKSCPMRGECRHFASAFASARLALPTSLRKTSELSVIPMVIPLDENAVEVCNVQSHSTSRADEVPQSEHQTRDCEPIIEEPMSPATEPTELTKDIEDFYPDDGDGVPTIKLGLEDFLREIQNYVNDDDIVEENSRAIVALAPEVASIPLPKLVHTSRLRTEHYVYELPDSHPLLRELERREVDDPCPYLFLLRTPKEITNLSKSDGSASQSQLFKEFEEDTTTIQGTILIPCRTALRGRFPLNGTYFQVNEVFADHESTHHPIKVPRDLIWCLRRRLVYFGSSATSIFRDLPIEQIQNCFWRGFICVRGFDRKMRAPRPLSTLLHQGLHKVGKGA